MVFWEEVKERKTVGVYKQFIQKNNQSDRVE